MVIDWNIHWVTAQADEILLLLLSLSVSVSPHFIVRPCPPSFSSFSFFRLTVSFYVSVRLLSFSLGHKLFLFLFSVSLWFLKIFLSSGFQKFKRCPVLVRYKNTDVATKLTTSTLLYLLSSPPSLPPSFLSPSLSSRQVSVIRLRRWGGGGELRGFCF